MRDLSVTLVQRMLQWEDAEANRRDLATALVPLAGSTDLVVLPEMFTTGFSMRAEELAETMEGPTVAWMKETARTLDAAIYGSVIITAEGRPRNRGLFVTPDGTVRHYDKRHLFTFAGEHLHYAAGSNRVVVVLHGWRLLLQVCYDLRFPVFSRNKGDYDVALYVANWPEARRYPWSQLLIARALENQAYVIGVNRVGMDGKGIHYSGDSAAIDPKGLPLTQVPPGKEHLVTVVLSWKELEEFRAKFPALADADDFELRC